MNWKPDIVHSNCEFSTFPLARKIASRLGVPLIHTYHTVYENYTHYISSNEKWGRKMARVLTRHIAAQTDALIAPMEKVKKLLTDYRVLPPIYVVPTGIDQNRFLPRDEEREVTREALGIPAGQAAKLGLGGRVMFAGMALPEEVSRYYQAGDLFVSASSSETQGLTYLEALASSLPLLCHRDACLKGVLLDGVNGWQYGTREECADRLAFFLAHPESRRAMSQAALRSSQRFGVSAFAGNVEMIYNKQIEKIRKTKFQKNALAWREK